MTTHLTDDEITDRIASEVAARIEARHPAASVPFRRRLVSLYTRQILGLEKPAGQITRAALGSYLGISGQRVLEIESTELARLYRRHGPTLREFLIS